MRTDLLPAGARAHLVVASAATVAAALAVGFDAPSWLTTVLVVVAFLLVAERLVRRRQLGWADATVTAFAGLVVVLMLLGFLLNEVPGGLARVPWAVGSGVLALLAVAWGERPTAQGATALDIDRRVAVRLAPAYAVGAGLAVVALIVSVHVTRTATSAPAALSVVHSSAAGRVAVEVATGSTGGHYELVATSAGRVVDRLGPFAVGSHDHVRRTLDLPADRRSTIALRASGSSTLLRSLVVSAPADTPGRAVTARPLRVLEVSQRYFPDLGGTESHIHEVTTRMVTMPDIDPTVLATDRSRSLPRAERTAEGFDVIRRNSYPRTRDYYVAPGIARVIRDGDWDVVHFQGVHTFVPIVGMLAARRARKPYVLTFHTGGHSSPSRSAIRDAQWRVLTPLLRGAARLIAVSRYERRRFEDATGIDPSHFTVIRNGGTLPDLPEPVTPIPGRVVSSGRLERYKGHHRVIEALPALRRLVPDAHLVILGGGDYESELRELAARLGVAEHVQIYQVDPRQRSAMAAELASAQVLAALSDYEAHPVAIMEALTLGTPVVGSDVAGTGDLVEDGLVTGLSVGTAPDDVAAALATAMAGGRRPLDADVDFPSWDTCAAQLADVYREVAAGRGR